MTFQKRKKGSNSRQVVFLGYTIGKKFEKHGNIHNLFRFFNYMFKIKARSFENTCTRK